ncbi:unnamed protein product [Paramecium sonneborni]|uniref:Uncharacterized protein n=1 Tax=Paramecium sonneborni TaxID=65129 RepID=A0A8S1RNF2_9CILI|nr:unnamed protein product [Paramecium sonneborni]
MILLLHQFNIFQHQSLFVIFNKAQLKGFVSLVLLFLTQNDQIPQLTNFDYLSVMLTVVQDKLETEFQTQSQGLEYYQF